MRSEINKGNAHGTGNLVEVRGFWGDIVNSPYFSFGIETHAKDRGRLFKIASSQYAFSELPLKN